MPRQAWLQYTQQVLYEAVRHTGMLYALQPAYLWWAFRCRYTALLDKIQEVGYAASFDILFREVRARAHLRRQPAAWISKTHPSLSTSA
jgi:hypothetical protein